STNYLIESVPTLPRILATHGYRSFQSGKHWEGSYRTAGFTHGMTTGLPTQRVSDITGTRAQKNGDLVAHGNGDAGLVIGRETMQPLLDFIDQQSQESPFFLWYAPFLPHTPFDAPERFREVYTDRSVPAYLLPYYAEIARFDETVGTLIAALRERNLMQETIVIFVSDNGFRPDISAPDRQDKRSKLSEFDDGLRTPILIYQEGRTCCNQFTQLVHTVDLVPTILDAVGYSEEVTPRMKGVSLWKAATTGTPPEDRPVFGAIYPNDAEVLGQPSRHVRFRWVRKGSWKLIVPAARDRSGGLRLFNLNDDPTELHNLANNPDHQSLIAELQQALNQWWTGNDNADVTQR
ncbi:MAG: sulfatase-like hydrolase/transferase, partial [Planctomycetaceae bacterium]|nr:sulfatase-like hydrolase/transferase [Planctomycetaceae bacterium]